MYRYKARAMQAMTVYLLRKLPLGDRILIDIFYTKYMRGKKLLVTCVPPLIVDNNVRRVGTKEVNCQMVFYFGWNYLRILEDSVC